MLPNNDIVRNVYTGTDGVLSGLQNGSFLIDSSTVDPAVSKEVASLAKNAGAAAFVDAPVSGGVNAAAGGTLTFMVGAPSESDFNTAKAILENMGKTIIHCGDVGTGGAVKICNNMLLAVSMIGVSETMNLGIK
jgi:3-hydroxyisobutyrate dehydrogenase